MKTQDISKSVVAKGSTVGFDAAGRHVIVKARAGGWSVWTERGDMGYGDVMCANISRQTFATRREAVAYAATIIDDGKTAELRWW